MARVVPHLYESGWTRVCMRVVSTHLGRDETKMIVERQEFVSQLREKNLYET